jgi:3-deoxy-D-manno-octulosonic acid (KDO) 8-phosphate synthase
MFDRMQINDPVSFEQAFVMAKKHASEFGKHKIQWLLKNSFIRETRAAAYREGLTEALEIVDHVREVHEQQCWAGRDHADVAFKEIQSKITSLSETN